MSQRLKKQSEAIKVRVLGSDRDSPTGQKKTHLQSADLFSALIFGNHYLFDPKNPYWPERDRLIVACQECRPIFEAAFSLLRAVHVSHASIHHHRAIEDRFESHHGPRASGLSRAVKLAQRIIGSRRKVVYVIGDSGHQDSGRLWQAVYRAAERNLNNICKIVVADYSEAPKPISKRFEAFGWRARDIDGHDYNELATALEEARVSDRPLCLVAHTRLSGL